MWVFRLTIYRDGYLDRRLYRADHKDQLNADIARCVNKGIKFKIENI